MIAEGTTAPDFRVQADDGRELSLGDYRGRWVVLYFYPRADTPG
jgi:peroxiredoxin Q/BCP